MNCANHADVSAVAYCRTCGKPLCVNCTRDVRGVIYCENCLAARLEGVQPPATPPAPGYPPAAPMSGPNPALAGILGAIPFGVGAVYNGQYAKGLAHLVIFSLLVIGASHGGEALSTLCGIGIAFFVLYQIVDAVRSARAIQMGQTAPDPLGLGQAFGAGEKIEVSKIPVGAVVLIALGSVFLLRNIGLFNFDFDRIWPVFLIAIGLWLGARGWGLVACSGNPCYCARCRMRRMMWPAVLVTVGMLSLLENTTRFGWNRTWPVLVLVVGIVLLLRNSASTEGHVHPIPPAPPGSPSAPGAPPADTAQQPANEVRNV